MLCKIIGHRHLPSGLRMGAADIDKPDDIYTVVWKQCVFCGDQIGQLTLLRGPVARREMMKLVRNLTKKPQFRVGWRS